MFNLVAACLGTYTPTHTIEYRSEKGAVDVGPVPPVALSLLGLRSDLGHELHELAKKTKPGPKARERMKHLDSQLDLVTTLIFGVCDAKMEQLRETSYDGCGITADGMLFRPGKAEGEPQAFPQSHPVRQAAAFVVAILAGAEAPEETGVRDILAPDGPQNEKELAAANAEPVLATVDDLRLRRLWSLAAALREVIVIQEPASLNALAELEGALKQAARAVSETREAFWALVREAYDLPPSIVIRSDWAVVENAEERDSPFGGIRLGGIKIVGLGEMLAKAMTGSGPADDKEEAGE